MTTIYKYRIRCTTDNKYEYIWDDTLPTTCPANAAHSIDSSKTTIVDRRSQKIVEIKEETTPTGGFFMCETLPISVDASATTSFTYTWPIPITVLMVGFTSAAENEGDVMSLSVAPDTTIGTLTSNIGTGVSTLDVSQTVVDNIKLGFHATITDGVNTNQLGRCLAINTVAKTITIETSTTNSFNTNSLIKMTIYMMKNYTIGPAWEYEIGNSKIGGSYVPAGRVVKVVYENKTNVAKTLVPRLEYLY